jgi:hypothetical protein
MTDHSIKYMHGSHGTETRTADWSTSGPQQQQHGDWPRRNCAGKPDLHEAQRFAIQAAGSNLIRQRRVSPEVYDANPDKEIVSSDFGSTNSSEEAAHPSACQCVAGDSNRLATALFS